MKNVLGKILSHNFDTKYTTEKISSFSSIIKDAGYAKRMPPSIKQIKMYLKKEKKVSKSVLDEINEDNIVQKFDQICQQ